MTNEKKANKWLSLILMGLAYGAIYRLPYLRETYYLPLQQATGTTNAQLGLLMSAYAIANTVFYFFGGWASDRFSSKKLITFSCITTGIVGFYYATFPPFPVLVVIHMIWAVTTVFTFWSAMLKVISLLGDSNEQGRLFGLLEFFVGITATVLSFVSVGIFSKYGGGIKGFRSTIIFFSISIIVIGILCMIFVQDEKPVKSEEKQVEKATNKEVFEVLKMPRVWLAGVLIFTTYSIFIGFGMLTPYLTKIFNMSQSTAAVVSSIRAYVLLAAGSILGGFIADKMGSRIKLTFIGFIGMFIFSIVYFFLPGKSSFLMLAIINMIVLGFFIYVNKALFFATIGDLNISKKVIGTATGIMSLIGYLPEIFLYTAYGNILDKNPGIGGYKEIFLTMIILAVAGMFAAFALIKMVSKKDVNYTDSIMEK